MERVSAGAGGSPADEGQPEAECEGGQELEEKQGVSQDLWVLDVGKVVQMQ